ncbi:hypothetical protein [Bacillus pinisoli]|uniref:hypothetical protein n=1 Tax=Bacillus pinisoli TaxID=2901866 RepID=UPI001FF492BE|nr:hypothetical protein [Bacillus pinisoli]
MKLFIISVKLLLFSLFLSGCTSEDLELLQNERNQLERRVQVLEQEVAELSKNTQKLANLNGTLTLSYLEKRETYRFIPDEIVLQLIPHNDSIAINKVNKGTVVEVFDYVDVNGEIWLYAGIPVFDNPVNMKGWIKESDTQLYSLEKQAMVIQPVVIKKGTSVYKVEISNQSEAVEPFLLEDEQICFVSDRQGEHVALGCADDSSYIVHKHEIVYPDVK